MLIKVFRARINELKYFLIIDALVLIIGVIILTLVLKTDDEPTSFEVGTMLIIMSTVLFTILIGAFGFREEFNKAVGMGVTRRQFVPAYFVTTIIFICIQYAAACLSHFFEMWEIKTFWSSYTKEAGVETVMFSRYVFIIIVAAALIQLFAGSCMLRFGNKAYYVMAVVWAALCMLPAQLIKVVKKDGDGLAGRLFDSVCDFAVKYADSWLLVIAVLFMALCAAGTYLIIRKQQVTA
ncbi:MAG: hypothetical protein Q4F11_06610 [Eubacteriales bacterium]|nr:hypothetical protein [Eubacteriales bacterium]